jgi:hypothetical protein
MKANHFTMRLKLITLALQADGPPPKKAMRPTSLEANRDAIYPATVIPATHAADATAFAHPEFKPAESAQSLMLFHIEIIVKPHF